MTLPQNVADALESADANSGLALVYIERDDYMVIRAHLVTQEAEIELLRVAAEQNLSDAKIAESRLAAANALLDLLRTGRDGKKYACVESRDGSMVEVTTYLQGAGDEGGLPA